MDLLTEIHFQFFPHLKIDTDLDNVDHVGHVNHLPYILYLPLLDIVQGLYVLECRHI